jgi:thiamine-phosphate pyrophosphorylase
MNKGIYLIWDVPSATIASPDEFFDALEGDYPCAVQLRAKQSQLKPLIFDALVTACRHRSIQFIINDHIDWLVPGVDGIHLGQGDGDPPNDTSIVVGRSTHTLEQVRQAASDDRIAMLGFGPIRETYSKRDALAARGFDLLARAVEHAQHKPVVAIGGLTVDDLLSVHQTGAHAAAVISSVWSAPDPVTALRLLVRSWNAL